MTRRRRRSEESFGGHPAEPRSNVHVLTSEEELRDALKRSAQFERAVVDKVRDRADRYEALITPASITQIGVNREMLSKGPTTEEHVDQPHSA